VRGFTFGTRVDSRAASDVPPLAKPQQDSTQKSKSSRTAKLRFFPVKLKTIEVISQTAILAEANPESAIGIWNLITDAISKSLTYKQT
jgi:hypothetical protein